jgi:Fe-Mn family superoxide dismutase
MAHTPKNFDHLIGDTKAFLSEKQLQAHFTLYQGYVKKLSEIEERLTKADPTTANYSFSEYSELRRREPVAYNGTILHELYFANLGAPDSSPSAAFKHAVESSFGTWDAFIADIKGIVGSGHGWALVTYDHHFNRIRTNQVQGEHHVGLLPDQQILIAIDAWEHAYFLDYATKKADYLTGVLKHINWNTVEKRAIPALQHLAK